MGKTLPDPLGQKSCLDSVTGRADREDRGNSIRAAFLCGHSQRQHGAFIHQEAVKEHPWNMSSPCHPKCLWCQATHSTHLLYNESIHFKVLWNKNPKIQKLNCPLYFWKMFTEHFCSPSLWYFFWLMCVSHPLIIVVIIIDSCIHLVAAARTFSCTVTLINNVLSLLSISVLTVFRLTFSCVHSNGSLPVTLMGSSGLSWSSMILKSNKVMNVFGICTCFNLHTFFLVLY